MGAHETSTKEHLTNFTMVSHGKNTNGVLVLFLFTLQDRILYSFPALSTHEGVNQPSIDVTQAQHQRPESPTVTLT